MKKSVSLLTAIIVAVICMIVTFVGTYAVFTALNEGGDVGVIPAQDDAMIAKLKELDAIARKNYVGEIDDDYLTDYVMAGYMAGLKDKYASYYNKEDMDTYLASFNSELVGIGVYVVYDETVGGIYITGIIDNSPAQEAGLMPGDIITAVGDTRITLTTYNQVVMSIRGKEGEERTLTILRAPDYTSSEVITFKIKKITTKTVNYELLDGGIAYIEITNFNTPTPTEFAEALTKATEDGAGKYIFDVRSNPGGDLNAIASVLDMLLPKGPIVNITDASGKKDVIYSDAEHCLNAPIVVLTNGSTASAAELFTSALRDYKMSVTIGTTTYGKGTVLSLMRLSDGSGIALSTSMYNPPYGDNFEGIGITPDIEVKLTEEQAKNFYMLTHEEDPQLQAAIAELNK